MFCLSSRRRFNSTHGALLLFCGLGLGCGMKMLGDPLHSLLRLASTNNFIAILRFRNLPTLWNTSTSSQPHQQLLFWAAQCNERHQRPTFCMPGPVMLYRDGQQELSTRSLVTTIAYYSIGPLNLTMPRRAASLDLSGSSVE